jgi:uncharacterized DUF497 family protein
MEFRWNAWNLGHISGHGVIPLEAEYVVERPDRGYPRYEGDGKFLACGQTAGGRYLQVIYVFDSDDVAYVVHARPLTNRERQKLRRKRRR